MQYFTIYEIYNFALDKNTFDLKQKRKGRSLYIQRKIYINRFIILIVGKMRRKTRIQLLNCNCKMSSVPCSFLEHIQSDVLEEKNLESTLKNYYRR